MPFFSRRRIQAMLIDLSNHLNHEKAQDLTQRLNKKNVDQKIPAEIELALLWAIEKTGDLVIEPEWWASNNRPDAYSETLIEGYPTIVEIATHSDGRISFDEAMDSVTLRVCEFASSIKKGIGEYLYFTFAEKSGYNKTGEFRHVLATKNYVISDHSRKLISDWLSNKNNLRNPVYISDGFVEFAVEKREEKQKRYYNYFTTMPPETYSLNENPLFELLKRKLKQIKDAPKGTYRVIILADAGSKLLSSIGRYRPVHSGSKTGEQIISNFLEKYRNRVDVVVTMTARRTIKNPLGYTRSKIDWKFTIFKSPNFNGKVPGIEQIRKMLPSPLFEGYQVRSLTRQKSFNAQSLGWYTGMEVNTIAGGNGVTVKISARALLEFLSGRTDERQLRSRIDSGVFENLFKDGNTLISASMETRDLDQEDDYLVLEFEKDPAASKYFHVN